MKLTTRTRYGIRALLELTKHYVKGPLQLRTIVRHQEVSAKYLEQIITILRSEGIVRSVRGSKGGYVLARSPAQIRISDCFNCLEGPVVTTECVRDEKYCARTKYCAARQIWIDIQSAVMDVLQSMTLQNVVDQAKHDQNLNYQI